ncbi:MAG: response regulator [Gammaproteobacteria bacterium]|uniref:response regulator n=1 Tax=Marinomonas sp. ef1 TaxID=2005043 RepID=UPI000C28EDFF|nr:response regulator [Marinomonas sp. ef1]MBU1296024.1 response regulator [Gammaproteobacteria bacterium]MBU1468808.1 response regulator [Gammaproteobacteria bacterium]MBU2024772.1 response regulator [Gammaproteobacteria bacterium]MBU2237826.1 response regulator [Gammaproteobacteria bacterium]MBU2319169.1 response regulator [Gammaproteobacteria bacterium]
MTDISSAEDSKKNSVEDTTKKSVLIIEDMNEMRLMLRSMMLSLGYTNIEAEASGQSALKRIAAKHFDIILSDYNLGGRINGQQVLETSRRNNILSHSTIFIMITADTGYDSVVSAIEHRPDSYMVKPFTPATLHRRLSRIKLQKNIFSEVDEHRGKMNFEMMESKAKAIMIKHPQYSSLCLKVIGESLLSRKEYKAAKIHYMRVLKHNQETSWAHFGIAQCDLGLEQPLSAVKSLEKTISITRHFLPAYDTLANTQERLGNLKEAQKAMIASLEITPRSLARTKKLGKISVRLKDWKMAEQAYSRVIRLTKDTQHEKIEYYYEHLKCLIAIQENDDQAPQTAEKLKRSLTRLRMLGKDDPIVVSNSFRVEVQQHLNRERKNDAVKSWKQWKQLILSGKASSISHEQELTLKRKLGL